MCQAKLAFIILVGSIWLASSASAQINADGPLYHLRWNGTNGTLDRDAIHNAAHNEPAQHFSLALVRCMEGFPSISKHEVWFLARSKNTFALLWCYLDDSGSRFESHMYLYPMTVITNVPFTGNYHFQPPDSKGLAVLTKHLALLSAPQYDGPDFVFQDWTRSSGSIDRLDVHLADDIRRPPTGKRLSSSSAIPKTLFGLRMAPMYTVEVPDSNPYEQAGWQELHALAYDKAKDPYYLVLYSNSQNGFVIDLKRALVYSANFHGKVIFK